MHIKTSDKLQIKLAPVLLSAFIIGCVMVSCTHQRMVCPAYQSAFLFDTTALKKKFSYFVNDTPKIYEVNKNKFLLIEPVPYRKMMASFRTIEMLPIYPVIPDSLRMEGDAEMLEEMDSTGVVSQEKELHPGLIGPKFNVEQENYMYYFRKNLILPDVRDGMAIPEYKSFSLKRWIKGLFNKERRKERRKKRRAEREALNEDVEGESTEETTEENEEEEIDQEEPTKKKGIFGRKKKEESGGQNVEGT